MFEKLKKYYQTLVEKGIVDRFTKRLKSFLWRTLITTIIAVIAMLLDILPELGLNDLTVLIVANVLAELSKDLNNYVGLFGSPVKK